jgi:hypothetical protein
MYGDRVSANFGCLPRPSTKNVRQAEKLMTTIESQSKELFKPTFYYS